MGRSVFIEELVDQDILNLYGVKTWTTGVIIGQCSLQRHHVLHIALTPPQGTGQESEEVEGDRRNTIVTFNEDWFVQHCRQVNRMLSGGLNILGIFVFGEPEERNKLQVKLRQVLFLVHKIILNDFPTEKLDCGSNEQLLLQVCSATKRVTCFTIDVSDTKASFNPADVKYQSFVSKWSTVRCSVCLKIKFQLGTKSRKKSFYSTLKAGLSPVLTNITDSIASVNHVFISGDHILVQEKQKKQSEKSSSRIKKEDIEVQLYLTENADLSIVRKSCCGEVLLVGTLHSRAFVHPRATVKDAVCAIKCDVIRSLTTRFQLLCEDLEEEALQDGEIAKQLSSWVLPRRVFVPVCAGAVQVSDYIFKDEQPKDVLSRLSELMGVSVTEKDLILSEEFSDHVCTDTLPDEMCVQNGAKVQLAAERSVNYRNIGGVITAMAAIVITASLKFFWPE